MEIVPLVTLWLCMPLDATPPPVHPECLALFPGYDYAVKERDAAYQRWRYVQARARNSDLNALPDEGHWRTLEPKAYAAWSVWGDLCCCYNAMGSPEHSSWVCTKLKAVRKALGPGAFWAGQLPSPVDLSEWATPGGVAPVEVVPLP